MEWGSKGGTNDRFLLPATIEWRIRANRRRLFIAASWCSLGRQIAHCGLPVFIRNFAPEISLGEGELSANASSTGIYELNIGRSEEGGEESSQPQPECLNSLMDVRRTMSGPVSELLSVGCLLLRR